MIMYDPTHCRVLVRVVRVTPTWIKVCVPGWNSRSFFKVLRKHLPKYKFVRGYRFHAHANMRAEKVTDLNIRAPFEAGSAHVPSWSDLIKLGVVKDPLHLVTPRDNQ